MADAALSSTVPSAEMSVLLASPGPGFGQGGAAAPQAGEDVSVAGVMLLSALSVGMAIVGMVTLALFVMAGWWLVCHIPVPPFVMHLLVRVGLA